jgi:hypothetical protein
MAYMLPAVIVNPEIAVLMIIDGFINSPTSVLRRTLRHCDVLSVRLIPQDLHALNLDLFTLPSNTDFLRVH